MDQQEKIFPFPLFIAVSYLSALFFEEVPRLILRDADIWDTPAFIVFFLLEYGAIFSIAYALFHDKAVTRVIWFGIIFGFVWETFVMHKLNIVTFFLFPVLYGLMFWIPFKTRAVMLGKEVVTTRATATACVLILLVVLALLPFVPR